MASKEAQIVIALHAFRQNQFRSLRAAATAFNVCYKTLTRRHRGTPSRADSLPTNRKLTTIEEITLVEWIINMDTCGMPPTQALVRQIAEVLLKECVDGALSKLGVNWVSHFIS